MIRAILKTMRLYYGLPLSFGFLVIVCYLNGGIAGQFDAKLFMAFGSLLLIISAGYLLNDACDVMVDKINCPDRMVVAGKLRAKMVVALAAACFVCGLLLAGLCNLTFFIISSAISILLVFYDLFSKRIGIFKNIIVALLLASLYPLAWAVAEPADTPRFNILYIHPAWLFVTVLGYEMLKDIVDVKGDAAVKGKSTSYCDSKWFSVLSRGIIFLAALATIVPYLLGYCRGVYLAAAVLAVLLAGVSCVLKPAAAIRLIYAEVFIITAGSMADLLVYGP